MAARSFVGSDIADMRCGGVVVGFNIVNAAEMNFKFKIFKKKIEIHLLQVK